MRFLILTQYYPPEIGAPQIRLSAVARQLKTLGHEVEVVTGLPNYPTGRIAPGYRRCFYRREDIDGVAVHRVWLYPALGSGLRRMANYLSFVLTSLWGLLRCQRPDFVIVESPPLFLSMSGFLAARRWGAGMIVNIADLWPDTVRELGMLKDGPLLKLSERLEDWTYRAAVQVSAVTDGIRTRLIEEKGVPPGKVLFMPNGVDTELFKPRPPDVGLAEELGLQGKSVILYAGNIGTAQGLDTVLQASSLLSDREDIAFVLIGDGSERSRLQAMVREEGLPRVKFFDPAPPEFVARLFSIASAGLVILRDVPLFDGARPSKTMPALASSVPVLCSGAGEAARLVESIQAGIAVPPENPRALADAAVRLIDSPEEAREMGRRGRKYAETHLGWPTLVKDWLEQLSAHAN